MSGFLRQLFLPAFVFLWQAAGAITITDVRPDKTQIEVAHGEMVNIRFRISEPARVTLHIFDGRDLEIRRIDSPELPDAGEHMLSWDGKDWRGLPVPPEAYVYTLSAVTPAGASVEHDLTDATGGESFVAKDVKWDATAHELRYVLERPARVNVRVGIADGGPLLRTLTDWVPRTGGLEREKWDGYDAAHVMDVSAHPNLDIGVSAFALPENTIFVGVPPDHVRLIPKLPEGVVHRAYAAPKQKRMFDHSQQSLEERGDYAVTLRLPANLKISNGLAVIDEPVPLTIEVDERDRARAMARRFEPVFYVDGQFMFENEVGYIPISWVWDPSSTLEDVHYITINVRGYEGNFGMATRKVMVKRKGAQ